MSKEIHRHLDEKLDALRDSVLRLGGEAESALRRVMRSLAERDTAEARAVLDHDDMIDQLEVEVDRQAIDIFALRQPAARDLRFVMSVTKMAPVLERIADHACNIARAAIDLHHEPQLKNHVGLYRMGEIALEMLAGALDAFTNNDAVAARVVMKRDSEINALYNQVFHDLIEMMADEPATAQRDARLLFIAKHLERIGDYVTDICELTVFMAEAAIIKHRH